MPQGYEGLPDYYLKSSNPITPNLGLSLKGMDAIVAEDFVLIDTAIGGGGTAIQVNGAVIPAANFIDSGTVTFTVLGSNVSAHAAAGSSVDVNGVPIAAPNFINSATVTFAVMGGNVTATAAATVAPGAPLTSVQFNNGGVFGGSANLEWDNTNKILKIGPTGTGTFVEGDPATQPAVIQGIFSWNPTLNGVYNIFPVGGLGGSFNNSSLFLAGAVPATDYDSGLRTLVVTAVGSGENQGISINAITADAFASPGSNGSSVYGALFSADVADATVKNAWLVGGSYGFDTVIGCTGIQAAALMVYGGDGSSNGGAPANGAGITWAAGLYINTVRADLTTGTAFGIYMDTDSGGSMGISGHIRYALKINTTAQSAFNGVVGWQNPGLTAIDAAFSRLSAASIALGNGTQGDFSGTLKTTIVNAATGFQIAGAAASGHFLVGDGTNYVDNTALPSGTVLWNQIGNAAAALTLANAGFNTTFNQTSAVNWLWANTTAATLGTGVASPIMQLAGQWYSASGTAVDTWSFQDTFFGPLHGLATIGNFTETAGSVVTVAVTGCSYVAGDVILFNNLPTYTWLNNVWITLTTASSVTMTFTDPTTHGIQATHNESTGSVASYPTNILSLTHSGTIGSLGFQLPNGTAIYFGPPTSGGQNDGAYVYGGSGVLYFNSNANSHFMHNYFTANNVVKLDIHSDGGAFPMLTTANTTNGGIILESSISTGTNIVGLTLANFQNMIPLSGTTEMVRIGAHAYNDAAPTVIFQPVYGTANFIGLNINPTINQAAVTGTVVGVAVAGNVVTLILSTSAVPFTAASTTDAVTLGTNTSLNVSGITPSLFNGTATPLTITNSVETVPTAFVLTSVATTASGVAVYTGTITAGASNFFRGVTFTIAGFATGANNGTFVCTESTGTTITLTNLSAASETHAGTATWNQVVFSCATPPAAAQYGYIASGLTVATWMNGKVYKVLSSVASTSFTVSDASMHGASASQAEGGGSFSMSFVNYSKTTNDLGIGTDTGTIVQQATGTYTALQISVIETANGGAANTDYLINALAGAAGTTQVFAVDNLGSMYLAKAAAGAPTSLGTAGTIGQILRFNGVLYFCSVTGAAGAATWNSLNMTAV